MKKCLPLRLQRCRLGLQALLLGVALAGCQIVEATGRPYIGLIGEGQEIQLGREADGQIVAAMGEYPNADLQRYIDEIGARIAATTERPDLPWTFRVLDDDTVNAFALPGGFIYVTRGILAHFDNEAELAGVLGHEIGHVTGKHAVIRVSTAQLAQLGLGVATIIAPELQRFLPLAGIGMQLLFLNFSRRDEREADELGVRYMANVGQDPNALVGVMEMLEQVSAARGAGAIPEWLSTHPSPANRQENIREWIEELEQTEFQSVERERYLQRLDGMVYGPNPREGFIRQGVFYHPDLRFRYTFPPGWNVVNQRQAVTGLSPRQEAAIQITLSDQRTLQAAARALYGQPSVSGAGVRRTTINGIPAAVGTFTARVDQGTMEGQAAFLDYRGQIYQIIGYSLQQNWPRYAPAVRSSTLSFRELTDRGILAVQPQRLQIVRLNEPMTLQEYHARNPGPVPLEELVLLNRLQPDARLPRGRLLKRVTGERFD